MRHKYVQWTDYELFVRQVANAKALIAQLASADVVEIRSDARYGVAV